MYFIRIGKTLVNLDLVACVHDHPGHTRAVLAGGGSVEFVGHDARTFLTAVEARLPGARPEAGLKELPANAKTVAVADMAGDKHG